MTLDQIFNLASLVVVIGWVCLALAPVARTPLVRTARIVSGVLAVAYLVQLFATTQPVEGGSFTSLTGIVALFTMPGNVMLGWTHFLAFDLFVGAWEVEDAGAIGLTHWVVLVALVLTFMLGPIGLLTYALIRTLHLWRTRGRFF